MCERCQKQRTVGGVHLLGANVLERKVVGEIKWKVILIIYMGTPKQLSRDPPPQAKGALHAHIFMRLVSFFSADGTRPSCPPSATTHMLRGQMEKIHGNPSSIPSQNSVACCISRLL